MSLLFPVGSEAKHTATTQELCAASASASASGCRLSPVSWFVVAFVYRYFTLNVSQLAAVHYGRGLGAGG